MRGLDDTVWTPVPAVLLLLVSSVQWMTKRVFVVVLAVAYIISWCTPVVIITPQYFVNDPFWRCSHDCSCG